MEGSNEIAEIANLNFIDAGLQNIKLITGPFEESLVLIEKAVRRAGLVFIDGNHRKDAVLHYFDRMAKVSDNKTVIVIDDINSSREMHEAWCNIKSDHRVTVTVDLYRMGIVFFRQGMNHNDYIIRY